MYIKRRPAWVDEMVKLVYSPVRHALKKIICVAAIVGGLHAVAMTPAAASPACDAVNAGAFNLTSPASDPGNTPILTNWGIGDRITLSFTDAVGFSHNDGFFHGPTFALGVFGPLEQVTVPALGSANVSHTVVSGDLTNGIALDPENNDSVTATCVAGTPIATTTTMSASPNPSRFGQSVTFTATVSGSGGTPTGTVAFKDGGTTFGSGTLSGGVATISRSALAVGAHTITAVYHGDASFANSTSSSVTQTVNRGVTTTEIESSANPSVSSQSVTLTATVTATAPAVGTPTGTVTFMDGASTLGTGALSGGIATFATTTLTVGAHGITAVYGGSSKFRESTSPTLTQTVNKGATQTTLTASAASVKPGDTVSLRVVVAGVAPASGTPSGPVTLKEGSKTLGTVSLSSGEATFAVTLIRFGPHTFSASYGGSAAFAGSPSAAVVVTVDPKVGPEFRINSYTPDAQQHPSAAPLAGGGFVVVWESEGQDGSGFGVYGQRYQANGKPIDSEFRVNTELTGDQAAPSVAGLGNGGFVVAWGSAGQDGSGLGVYGQRFSALGKAVGGELRANKTTAGDQALPSVAALDDGGFVAVWESAGQDGSGFGIYGRRYDASGKVVGAEFRVNATTLNDQSMPKVAALTGGGFAVAWESALQDGSGLGVYAQRFDANGVAAGGEFRVNTQTANDQSAPAIAGLSDGGFFVTWESKGQDGGGSGIYGQRFDVQGSASGPEIPVNTTTKNHQKYPSVAGFPDGGFVVAWASLEQDGSGYGIYLQCYDALGNPVNGEFRANRTTLQDQWQPSVAAFAAGDFVVTWTSMDQDGSLAGVYGQRFRMNDIQASSQPANSAPAASSASRRSTR